MENTVIDRGGEIDPPDALPIADRMETDDRPSQSGKIAIIGAILAFVGAVGGIGIGYGVFHSSQPAKATAEPAKPSEHSPDEVTVDTAAQRAALARRLGQASAPETDIFGRPLAADGKVLTPPPSGSNEGPPVDVNGYAVDGQHQGGRSPTGRPANQAQIMADAARRSPIMAFGGSTVGGPSAPLTVPISGDPNTNPGFPTPTGGEPNGSAGGSKQGTTDFSAQLAHSPIEIVRATIVPNRSFLLSAGTVIPCTLQTAINSTQAGYVSCVINHDVFSENGRVVLLDKGTKVLGQYAGGITQGQARLFVLWTRALTPRGVAISLGSPAADSLGRSGVGGGVDSQFLARFGAALMLSVLEDASNIAGRAVAGNGTNTTQVPSDAASTILQGSMNVPPILKKNQGDTASIFVAKDFDFRPVYDIHVKRQTEK